MRLFLKILKIYKKSVLIVSGVSGNPDDGGIVLFSKISNSSSIQIEFSY